MSYLNTLKQQAFLSNNRDMLTSLEVPQETNTYKPLPYKQMFDKIEEFILKDDWPNFTENYNISRGGNRIMGIWTLENEIEDAEIKPSIAFVNSYDKSAAFRIVSGSTVTICKNGMMRGNAYTSNKRKHTGQEFDENWVNMISFAVEGVTEEYEKLVEHSKIMKEVELSEKDISYFLGDLYYDSEIITLEQLSLIKKIRKSKEEVSFKGNSLWDVYNNVTESLKHGNAIHQFNAHSQLHNFVESNYFELNVQPEEN